MAGHEGYSLDDLLAIGTRKKGINLNISATDINRSIPFAVSEVARSELSGFTEEELKRIGERQVAVPAMQPRHINDMPVSAANDVVQNILEGLQQFLGIRTK